MAVRRFWADSESRHYRARWLEIANIALSVGLLVGILIGVARSHTILYASLWRPVLRNVASSMVTTAAMAAIVLAIAFGLVHGVRRVWSTRTEWPPALAGGGFLLAALIYLGYRVNHDHLPSLGSPTSIFWNLILGPLFALLVVAFVVWARARIARPDRVPSPILRSRGVAAALVLVLVMAGFQPSRWLRESESPRSVILLVVDALRADHLGVYGYSRPTSPNIDRFAQDAVTFTQAISQSTFTKVSIASLLTGQFPYHHGVYRGNVPDSMGGFTSDVLRSDAYTLAEMLRDAGFVTAAWVKNAHLRPESGFDQGFTEYYPDQGTIASINAQLVTWLARMGPQDDLFTYTHYLDLHSPYEPRPPYDTMFGEYSDTYEAMNTEEWNAHRLRVNRHEVELPRDDVNQLMAYYDGLIRSIDDEIGLLLDQLKELGLYERSLIVLTADHGDAFMEHGRLTHSSTPYDEVVRVPLLIKFPEAAHAGTVIDDQVRLVDVMATMAETEGVSLSIPLDGRSLVHFLDPADQGEEPFPELAISEVDASGYPTVAIRTEEWKYVHHKERADELYALTTDPAEQHDVVDHEVELAASFLEMALEIVALRAESAGGERVVLDPATVNRLRSLGYIN